MLIDQFETAPIVSVTGPGMTDHPVVIACGVSVPSLGDSSDLSMSDLGDLKRKYSGLLIVFDRFRDLLLAADSSSHPEGEWSIREMLGHMVDTDREIWWPRIAAILENERPFLDSVDQKDLLERHNWNEQPVQTILAQFMQFRWNSAIRIKDLTLQDFARTGQHYEFGDITIANILQILIAHDAHYLAKIRRRVGLPEF
jgi:hypothetical protein